MINSAGNAPPVFGSSSANKARASSSAAVTGGVTGPVLRLFVNASTRNWMVAPAPPPYSADSPVPPNRSRSGLYPCSTRFCTISDVASCAPSAPPVTAALVTRWPMVSTVSGPSWSINLLISGTSTERMNRPRGATSNIPTGAA